MKTKELIEYLQTFDGDTTVGWMIVNEEAMLKYNIKGYELVRRDSIDYPVISIVTDGVESLKDIMEECKNGTH